MDPSRMVHRAVEHMHSEREDGDLLMDMAYNYTWRELKQMAANRDVWRARVKTLKKGTTFRNTKPPVTATHYNTMSKHSMKDTAPTQPTISIIPKIQSPRKTMVEKYLVRDSYEAFFRPASCEEEKAAGDKPRTTSQKAKSPNC